MTMITTSLRNSFTRTEWVRRITNAWTQFQKATVEGAIEVGRQIIAARDGLERGEFTDMMKNDLPFSHMTGYRFMAIAEDQRILTHGLKLPPSWRTLYEITRLDNMHFIAAIEDGTINPEAERSEIQLILNRLKRRERFGSLAAEPLPKEQTHIGLIDPPWKFEVWRESSEYGAAQKHYPVMSIEELCALDIGSCFPDDAMLFMWVTVPMRRQAFTVLDAWGFEYRTALVWDKVKPGMGYYVFNQHEDLVIASRGTPMTPEPANKTVSVIRERKTEHSVKPKCVYDVIDRMYPGLSKREFFARHWHQGPGWKKPWGNMV